MDKCFIIFNKLYDNLMFSLTVHHELALH